MRNRLPSGSISSVHIGDIGTAGAVGLGRAAAEFESATGAGTEVVYASTMAPSQLC